jgi:hypothetical protein
MSIGELILLSVFLLGSDIAGEKAENSRQHKQANRHKKRPIYKHVVMHSLTSSLPDFPPHHDAKGCKEKDQP